ncbi:MULTISPECIES: hypothetical protein, partial [unclassified Gilliamella]|uniref:hypothetical protein n=1 Tax=unclassified Gilliamella TaxID=2685620 RepID=UPI00132ACDDF
GADGLYFDLDIGGLDGSQLSWTVNTSGSLRATVSWRLPVSDRNRTYIDGWITDKSKNVTRVTLHGPEARSQRNNNNPSRITVPSLPQTFELVGRDSSGNAVVKYGFVLKQWFVDRSNRRNTAPNQTAWCNSLGYRLSRVRDLTNAVCSGWNINNNYPCTGAVGATPSSSNNVLMRHIGAGFFTEWGYMISYADADFDNYGYWTSDATGSKQFYVSPGTGFVGSDRVSYSFLAVCTAP